MRSGTASTSTVMTAVGMTGAVSREGLGSANVRGRRPAAHSAGRVGRLGGRSATYEVVTGLPFRAVVTAGAKTVRPADDSGWPAGDEGGTKPTMEIEDRPRQEGEEPSGQRQG